MIKKRAKLNKRKGEKAIQTEREEKRAIMTQR